MMQFDWNENRIRMFYNASIYTGFHENLSEIIIPKIESYKTLCDIGCGLGLIDVFLSKKLEKVTCMDINESALEFIKTKIKDEAINNINTKLQDCQALNNDLHYDVIFISFFGSNNIEHFLPHCKKLIVVIGGSGGSNYILPSEHHRINKNSYDDFEAELIKRQIPYKIDVHTLEFGQPFCSLEEARSFVLNYSPNTPLSKIDSFLNNKIIKTDSKQFPYYLSYPKKIGIFEIDGEKCN